MHTCSVASVVSDSLRPYRLQPVSLLCPWDSSGKNTGVGCHALLQRVFLTQGSNLGLLHCRQILYHWATREAYIYIALRALSIHVVTNDKISFSNEWKMSEISQTEKDKYYMVSLYMKSRKTLSRKKKKRSKLWAKFSQRVIVCWSLV